MIVDSVLRDTKGVSFHMNGFLSFQALNSLRLNNYTGAGTTLTTASM